MTIILIPPRAFAMPATVVALGLALAGALGAQGVPPAARAPRDTQPALLTPVAPSRPPTTVAPRAPVQAVQARVLAESPPGPLMSPSLSVESVRPAANPVDALDPRSAPAEQPAPPAPTARRPAIFEQRASVESDSPPSGATVRCKDGTFLLSPVDANSCTDRGGVAVVIPQRQLPSRPTP